MASEVGKIMGHKMAALGTSLAMADALAVAEGAKAITEATRASIRAVAPSGRLRGVGKKGAAVGARYYISGATANVQATGPLHLVERDTKAHDERPKSRGKKSKSGKRALSWGGGEFASAVVHSPGTKGKHPFAKGIEAGKPTAESLIRNRYANAARKGVAS